MAKKKRKPAAIVRPEDIVSPPTGSEDNVVPVDLTHQPADTEPVVVGVPDMDNEAAEGAGYAVEPHADGFILANYSGKHGGLQGTAFLGMNGCCQNKPLGLMVFKSEAEAWAAVPDAEKADSESVPRLLAEVGEVSETPTNPASVTIEVPLGDLPPPGTYVTRHVDVQFDESYPVQKETMSRFLNGLQRAGEKLASGKVVGSNADAFKWVLEQIGGGQ